MGKFKDGCLYYMLYQQNILSLEAQLNLVRVALFTFPTDSVMLMMKICKRFERRRALL